MPTLNGHKQSPPWPPANLLADFAGGSLTAAFGIVAALFNRTKNGSFGFYLQFTCLLLKYGQFQRLSFFEDS